MKALAEKWPDETTLALLEAQVSSFKQDWNRSDIEELAEALRKKLQPANQTKD